MSNRWLFCLLVAGSAACGGGSLPLESADLAARTDLVTPACAFEPFVDCGCGCCGGVEPAEVCVRASLGETLESVRGDPPRSTPEQCALAGCSLGIRYRCCE